MREGIHVSWGCPDKTLVCAPNPSWDPTLWNGGIPFVSEWHVSQEIISVGHEGTNRDDASYCRLDFFGSAGLCSMRGGAAAGPQQPAPAPSEPKDTDAKKRQGRQRKRQAGSDGWEEQVGKRNGNRQQIESLKFCRTTDTP